MFVSAKRIFFCIPLAILGPVLVAQDTATVPEKSDEPVVFHSDVALARVDAQVVDRNNRTITGLRAEDFVLRENGNPVPIRNFASENMPIDILLLLDVSASMRPHVERISNAAHDALRVLGRNDRVGVMVFDTMTRVRLSFRSDRDEISHALETLLRQERFNGGTHITRAMLDAADFVRREARPEARRAVVILTDDGSQDPRDDQGVERALARADAVLSFLQAEDLMPYGHPGGMPGGRGGHGGNIGIGGLGGIILGGGGMGGPRRYPGGGNAPIQNRNHSAGTADIARDSGGDTFPVDDAYALEQTLQRLRQRYALHYNSDPSKSADQRSVQVDLADATRRRYPDAEIHYRRVSIAGNGSRDAGAVSVTRAHAPDYSSSDTASSAGSSTSNGVDADGNPLPKRRRVAVDQTYDTPVNINPDQKSAPQ
jgi:VWFA-related protein